MAAAIVPDCRELAEQLAPLRRAAGGPLDLALTNGCFDLLHVGHVRLIAEASRQADLLVVALNSDASVRGNKGAGRPFVPLAERMEVLAALAGVDFVTSFDEPTADALIECLRPEVYVKGTDWTPEAVPERESVLAHGGRIAICGDEKTHSSSELGGLRKG